VEAGVIILPAIAISFTLGAVLGMLAIGPWLGRHVQMRSAPVARQLEELRAQVAILSPTVPVVRDTFEGVPLASPTMRELGTAYPHHNEGGVRK
jgi:hypothetical protein